VSGDSVREGYAAVSYPGGAFAQTHPARQAAIARLLGVPAPEVRTARILEIGCAQGYNLLPLAARLPDARFTGIDFSAQEINRGRALASAAGLTNIEFIAADLRAFAPPPGAFDYVIAHGILSWVPDDAKAALFALCARALSPHGVAYLSYNTYPGWKQREAVRDLMLMQVGALAAPADRLAAARQVLATLDQTLAGRPERHAALTREIIASMRRKHAGHFYHDDLDGVNDPCYFLQFAAWAGEHGLTYLAEAEWETMFPELLPPDARAALATFAGDRLRLEQHLDFLRNRTFRCSLLVHAGQPLPAQPDPAALRQCCFGTPLRPPIGIPPLAAGTPVQFGGHAPRSFETKDPIVKTIFTLLASHWPRRLAFSDLLASVRQLLVQTGQPLPPDFEPALLARLLDAAGRRLVDFLADTPLGDPPTLPPQPTASPLTRLMAGAGLPVVNAWHESIPLVDEARAFLATLDGSASLFSPAQRRHLAEFGTAALLEPAGR
jgi:SAM-dependent methyltransferase